VAGWGAHGAGFCGEAEAGKKIIRKMPPLQRLFAKNSFSV
jgi:hypothetical protein